MLKKIILLAVLVTLVVGCANRSRRYARTQSTASHLNSAKETISSNKAAEMSNSKIKLGSSEWLVNGNCVLTLPHEVIKPDLNAAPIIASNGFIEHESEYRAAVAENSTSDIVQHSKITWSGGCNSNGKTDGHGIFLAKLFQHWIRIEGTMKDGQFYGKLKSQAGSTYTGTIDENCNCSRIGCCIEVESYAINGKFFRFQRDFQEYENPSLKTARLAEEEREKKKADQEQREQNAKLQKFQKNITVGTDTSSGVVVDTKGSLVKIQTNESQCTQRDYKDHCVNYVNTPAEKWFKRSEVYPK